MKKISLLFIVISMTIIISGCGDIVKVTKDSSSTSSLTSGSSDTLITSSKSSSTTSNNSTDSAKSILFGNTYYVSRADNGYTKHVFGETLEETSYTEDGEVIETNTFSISYSDTTVTIDGDIYEVTKQTHSITIVGDGKTRVFWDAIEYTKGKDASDAESILSGKIFYMVPYETDNSYFNSNDIYVIDIYSYKTFAFSKNEYIFKKYNEYGEVIVTNTIPISSYIGTKMIVSSSTYEVIRKTHSVEVGSSIMWDTLDYAKANPS